MPDPETNTKQVISRQAGRLYLFAIYHLVLLPELQKAFGNNSNSLFVIFLKSGII